MNSIGYQSVFEILCSKNFTAQKMCFFFTFFFLIIKTNDLQCHNQSKFCPKVQFSSFSSENWQFGFFVHAFQPKLWSIKHEECKTLKNGCEPPKVLETVSQRAIDNFQSPLKRFTSRRHKIVKCVYLLSEMTICLSKQSKFATNAPISFIFNFWSPVTSRGHN